MSDQTSGLSKKSAIINSIIVHMKDYYSSTVEYVNRYSETVAKNYKEQEHILDKYYKELSSSTIPHVYNVKSLPDIVKIFDLWNIVINKMRDVFTVISDEDLVRNMTSGLSQSLIHEIKMKLSSIRSLFSNLNIINSAVDQEFIEKAKKGILTDMTLADEDKFIEFLCSAGINCVNDVIIGLLSAFKPSNKRNEDKFNEIVNKIKQKSLPGVDKLNILNNTNLPAEMQLTSRFSLIPATAFMSKQDIEKLLKCSISDCLVVRKQSRKPMQYNILSLLSTDYVIANDMLTSEMSGLNKKILKRFSIITTLPGNDQCATSGEQNEAAIVENDKDHSEYVIECINDTYYRIMTVGISETYKTDKTVIKEIRRGVSSTAMKYSEIAEKAIIAKCINKEHKKLMVKYNEKQLSPPSVFSLKEQIITEYMAIFSKMLAGDAGVKRPALRNIRKQVIDIALDSKNILRSCMMKYVFGTSTIDSESLITFAVKFETTNKEFNREILGNIDSVNWKDNDSSEEDKLKNILISCKKIITNTVESMDAKPSRWVNMDLALKNIAIEYGLHS